MANPRSIILAVVSAKNDFPNQIVLKRAQEVDLDSSDQDQDRDAVETQFFAESTFRSLSAINLGIAHLRQRLSLVLFGQIKAELPRLIKDIEVGISRCCQGLESLGPARVTLDDQKSFLVDISDDFQTICKAAIKGDYEHRFFADRSLYDRRLSAMIANRGIDFAEEIRTEGAKWKIVESASSRKRYRTRAEAIEEVRKLLRKSRGRELPGLPNPLLVGEVFREYSQPWEDLARQYIKDVWHTTKSFVEQALQYLTDTTVSDALLKYLLDHVDQRLDLAHAKLRELMVVHQEHPETRNHYFTDNYNTLQRKQARLETTQVLAAAFDARDAMEKADIPYLAAMLDEKRIDPDMDLVAAESTFNAMEAFYSCDVFMQSI